MNDVSMNESPDKKLKSLNSRQRAEARAPAIEMVIASIGMLTIDDTALCLSTTRQKVEDLIEVGCLKCMKIGATTLISLDELKKFQVRYYGQKLGNKLEMIQCKKIVEGMTA